MSRRQAILETVLIFAVFCLQGAWLLPEVNEPYYLGKAIHYWNPQWASSDWFLHTADAHAVFYYSVGWLALILKPTAFAWTVRLLTWSLLAWSWQRFSRAVVPKAWASILTATLFIFLLQHYNMAGEWVVGGAEAKGFSFVLVFLALEALVEGYWNRMWLLLGAASAFHILVGGWAAIAAGTVWMLRSGNSPTASGAAQRQFCIKDCALSLVAPLIAFVLALPGLVPVLLMNRGVEPDVAAQAYQIYVFERFSHHLDPAKFWADGFVLPFLLLVGLWLLLWPSVSDSPGAKRLWGFTAVAVAIALIGVAISLLSIYNRAMAAGWMRFYWYRLADVTVPMALSLLSVRWFLQRKMRFAMATVIAVAAFHAVDCIVLKLYSDPPFAERQIDGMAWMSASLWATGQAKEPMFPRQPRADKLRNHSDWLDVCRWVSDPEHTPPDARFLIPRMAFTFKWYAGRGEVVNWKETPQDAANLVAWWNRIQDVYSTGNPPGLDKFYLSLADAGVPKLLGLAKRYDADYLVTQVSIPMLPLPVEYKNESFAVYGMR
ncbi:MAG: DUF6798 domain-containing protein [Planctomycetota bacterium]